MSRLIDADKLMMSLNDNFLANSPTGNETLQVKDYRESVCEGLEIAMATVEGAPTVGGWISVKDRMPENAKHPCAFCQRYLVYTDYGITEGWYNPDRECWYGFLTFMIDSNELNVRNIDLERGDVPKRVKNLPVKYWMPMPEPPKEESND